MAKTTLMRVSNEAAQQIKERADFHGRTQVAEMDRVIAAGLAALAKAEAKPPRANRKTA